MTDYSTHKTLKIGVDCRELLPNTFTGFGRYIENFLNAQITRTSQHNFILYGNQHTKFPEPNNNYTTKVIQEKNTLWWDQVSIVKALRHDKIDLFFTPYDKTPIQAPCPVVMTIHDLLYQYVSDHTGLKRWIYNTLYRMQRGYMARRAARVLTVSEHSRQDIVKYYGLNASQIGITHNAVSERFHPHMGKTAIDQVKKKYGITASYIFNLNNFKPHKNPSGVIEAYAQLRQEVRQTTHLVIGGKHNDFTHSFRQRVEQLGLSDQVHFPGMIDDNDLPAFYAGAKLLIIASFYEGFGIPPLEAMACGTPVISSNATSLPEVIGDAGLLVDPQNTQAITLAIDQLLHDNTLREKNIQLGLQHIKKFSQEKIANRILNALEETAAINRVPSSHS